MTYNISIDMGQKCAECGKGGACPSGICLKCTLKAFKKPLKSKIGQAVQLRQRMILAEARAKMEKERK